MKRLHCVLVVGLAAMVGCGSSTTTAPAVSNKGGDDQLVGVWMMGNGKGTVEITADGKVIISEGKRSQTGT